jgi:predicted component of type VI protein secretion system
MMEKWVESQNGQYITGSRASDAMNATLLVVSGNTTKRKVALKLPCVLGRSRQADVTVAHPLISRRHCELSETNGLLTVRDLASSNGTMIGGRRINWAPLLPDGEFTIGPLTFRVQYEYVGSLESPPPIIYADDDARVEELEFPDVAASDAGVHQSYSDSVDSGAPDFVAMADAEPEELVPPSRPANESPWATETPDVEDAKRAAPPPKTKLPNYGDDADPEFGSFLEDRR